MEIFNYKKDSLKKITLEKMEKNQIGTFIPFKINKKDFNIQFPTVDSTEINNYTIEINLEKEKLFLNFLESFRKHIAKTLFDRNIVNIPLIDIYNKIYMVKKNLKINIKLPFRYNKYECDFYDSNSHLTIFSELNTPKKIIPLVTTKGLWINKDGFGISWIAKEIMVL